MKRMNRLLRTAVLLTALIIIVLSLGAVRGYERTLAEGREVLIRLAPVDPRSLMQGDYMALRFTIDNELPGQRRGPAGSSEGHTSMPRYAYLRVDQVNRAVFAGSGDTLPHDNALVAMRIRKRDGQPSIGPNALFFEEGSAALFETAQWGEFRVAPDGTALLAHLRDANLERIGGMSR